jgi:hypothetical protein
VVALGLAAHALIVGLGAGVLIQEYPLLYYGLHWIGVGYLLFLALEGYRTVRETSPGRSDLATMGRRVVLERAFLKRFQPEIHSLLSVGTSDFCQHRPVGRCRPEEGHHDQYRDRKPSPPRQTSQARAALAPFRATSPRPMYPTLTQIISGPHSD